ncbi:spore gernimation protein [Cohnella endophytica]|uniref:Spore gernimation protein n=1 Tax=Cohnella endophytica TaxID=2419778 RepID=A0A494Y5T8_9BACL|nr:endospore germination permease [Cohnella endophytica]RKP58047.1 spore gernimation protein [Cohnella endophytica]
MTASKESINFLQACMILLLMNGLTNHVIVNPMLLDASGRDSWIAPLAAGLLFIPWCFMLIFIMRKSGQNKLQPWLSERTNAPISWILVFPLLLQLYMIGGLTVIHTTNWTINNYLPATPKVVLAFSLTVLCTLCASWGIRAIAITSGILLPIVVALGFFAGISNIPEKNFSLIKPFLENGWSPVFAGTVYAGGGFIELIVLLAMQHRLNKPVRRLHLVFFALFSIYIMTGPLIGAITEFGPAEAAKQMVSPYEQWRLVKLGNYFEHIDFFSIYQWLAGASIRIGLSMYLIIEVLPIRTNRTRNLILMAIAFSYVAEAIFPINSYDFYSWMYHFYFPVSLAVAFSASLSWTVVSLFSKSQKRRQKIA